MGRVNLWVVLLILMLSATTAPVASGQARRAPILRGWVTADSLFSALPRWRQLHDSFQPDTLALRALRAWNLDHEVLVFFGSWCPDSRREVPRFIKTVDLIQNPHVRYRLYALDRSKRDAAGLAQRYHISGVPTFIVLENGQEMGRIEVHPRHGLERDWVGILLKDPDWCVRIERMALAFRVLLPTFYVPLYLHP